MYELIQHQEVGSGGAASITFSGIPQIYTDLYLIVSGRASQAANDDALVLDLNGTTLNESIRLLRGTGSSTLSASGSYLVMGYMPGASATANTFGNANLVISNYSSNTLAKALSSDAVFENNGTAAIQQIQAMLWDSTSPITSIEIKPDASSFVQYTTATLFGVGRKAGIGRQPLASGGYTSFLDGYWVHTFTANGSFKPFVDLDVEYLVVAGGGGGGYINGGGGAGGYRSSVSGEMSGGGSLAESPLSLTASTNYSVTVGAGGSVGGNGSDSVFSTITSTGGGAGGAFSAGASGGSGGGGAYNNAGGPGAGTAGQGFAGGDRFNAGSAPWYAGGGGGGAGSVGANGSGADGGSGGSGVPSSITGSVILRAGGGGGGGGASGNSGDEGDGGTGTAGGGNGATYPNLATTGTANTGGGGGGGASNYNGAAASGNNGTGGSGIVIVRYRA